MHLNYHERIILASPNHKAAWSTSQTEVLTGMGSELLVEDDINTEFKI